MKTTLIALVITLLSYPSFAQHTNTLVSNYMAVKNALASDDNKAAQVAATAFVQSITVESDFPQKARLLNAADRLAQAGDISQQLARFADVSPVLWELVKGTDTLHQTIYYDYCPMKKVYWLSTEAVINNPYFGSEMPTCGSVKDKKGS